MNLLNHSNFSGALSPTACREREVFVWSHFAPYCCPECYARFSSKINLDCKVYVGDLPRDASEKELERCFSYYGPLRSVWVARNPAGFAFVEFEDPRDSEDAVRALDGTTMCGVRVRVEHSTGKVRPKPWMRGSRGPPRPRKPFHPNDKCYECGEKGHYAYDCYRYRRKRSSRYRGRSRSRSRSRSRRRSYSRSRSRSSSRSRSRSPPSHSKSRSYSRSPSRSRSHSHGRETPSKNGNEKYKA